MPATGPAALDERPRRRVVLLAAPWAVALALVVAALLLRPPAAPTSPSAATSPTRGPADGPSAHAPGTPDPSTPGVSTSGVPAGTVARSSPAVPAAVRLQVLAHARAALGTAGLAAEDHGRTDRWPVEVRLTEVTAVTDTLAIATVHALVIELTDAGWTGPVLRAAAVPLVTSPQVRVAGPGWPIAAPALPVETPDGAPVAEPDPAMVTPLQQAGWEVDELVAVELVGGAVLRVALTGAPPDGGERGHHVVWLLDAPGGPRLLPLDAPTPAEHADDTEHTEHTEHTEDAQHTQDPQEST